MQPIKALLFMVGSVFLACSTLHEVKVVTSPGLDIDREALEACLLEQEELIRVSIDERWQDKRRKDWNPTHQFFGDSFKASVWRDPDGWTTTFRPRRSGSDAAGLSAESYAQCVARVRPGISVRTSDRGVIDLR